MPGREPNRGKARAARICARLPARGRPACRAVPRRLRLRLAAAACPPGDADYPPFYDSADLFDRAIEKVADYPPSNVRLTGITVPHHLLADRLVALGFRAASGSSYKRIVILTPDHFRKADKPFATTRRGFETVRGRVATDATAVGRLLKAGDWIEESCLFDKDHGIRAMLPFVKHYFPDARGRAGRRSRSARGAPIGTAWRMRSRRWSTAIRWSSNSTDFSHYLPQHEARRFDQQTLNVLASGSLDGIAALRPAAARRFGRRALHPDQAAEGAVFGRAAGHRQRELAALFASAYAPGDDQLQRHPVRHVRRRTTTTRRSQGQDLVFRRRREFRPLDEEGAARRGGRRPHRRRRSSLAPSRGR